MSLVYFDRQAPAYQKRSESGPWAWLRRREAAGVFDLLGGVHGQVVLDLGCGAGYYTRAALQRSAAHVVAVDSSAAMISQLPAENVTPIQAEAADVETTQHFSRAVAAGLLEFAPDDRAVLENVRRLMNPGGVLVVLVPRDCLTGRGYRKFHRMHGVHIRLYTASSLQEMAEKSHWKMEKTRPVGLFSLAARMTPGQ